MQVNWQLTVLTSFRRDNERNISFLLPVPWKRILTLESSSQTLWANISTNPSLMSPWVISRGHIISQWPKDSYWDSCLLSPGALTASPLHSTATCVLSASQTPLPQVPHPLNKYHPFKTAISRTLQVTINNCSANIASKLQTETPRYGFIKKPSLPERPATRMQTLLTIMAIWGQDENKFMTRKINRLRDPNPGQQIGMPLLAF